MIIDPYDTTPCRTYNTDKIRSEIKRLAIERSLEVPQFIADKFSGMNFRNILAIVDSNDSDSVPAFAHPIIVNFDDSNLVCVDLRGFVRASREGTYSISSYSDLSLMLYRAILTNISDKEGVAAFTSLLDFPTTVYSRWIPENIARRLSLDAHTQLNMNILFGYFFLAQTYPAGELSDKDKDKIASRISRNTHITAGTIVDALENQPRIDNIKDLIDVITSGESVRLKDLNVGLLYSMISGGWFGANSREIMAVSAEHIPTFLALLYAAMDDRSYKRSFFAKTVEGYARKNNGDFLKQLKWMLFH